MIILIILVHLIELFFIFVIIKFVEKTHRIDNNLAYATKQTKQIINYICKIVLMPDNNMVYCWKQEIANLLNEIDKMDYINTYPTKEQIMNLTYYKQESMLKDTFKMKLRLLDIVYEYKINYKTIDYVITAKIIDDFCKDYFSWISDELSKYGYVNKFVICDKLDTLIDSKLN